MLQCKIAALGRASDLSGIVFNVDVGLTCMFHEGVCRLREIQTTPPAIGVFTRQVVRVSIVTSKSITILQ
jgi:hypothetical protein